jgi:hypothetical protein
LSNLCTALEGHFQEYYVIRNCCGNQGNIDDVEKENTNKIEDGLGSTYYTLEEAH